MLSGASPFKPWPPPGSVARSRACAVVPRLPPAWRASRSLFISACGTWRSYVCRRTHCPLSRSDQHRLSDRDGRGAVIHNAQSQGPPWVNLGTRMAPELESVLRSESDINSLLCDGRRDDGTASLVRFQVRTCRLVYEYRDRSQQIFYLLEALPETQVDPPSQFRKAHSV
jgi:hypothetical protein